MMQSVGSRRRSISRGASVLALIVAVGASGTTLAQSWPSAGADLNNSHFQADETQISPKTVPNLTLKWKFATAGDVTAIPAVVGGYVYFPDAAGNIYKVNASTGALQWTRKVSDITGVPGDYARATPAVTGNTLIIGSQSGKLFNPQKGLVNTQAQVFALRTGDGSLIWKATVDQTPQSVVTNSAVIAPGNTQGIAIVGVASNEALRAALVPPALWRWSFRGSALALDVATGAILWQTFTVPPGYYGGSVWGSTASVDLARNQVYVATGHNFMVPSAALSCLALGDSPSACLDPADYADSILALDLTTGKIKWAGRGMPADVWSAACGLSIQDVLVVGPGPSFPGVYGNCPDPTGEANPKLVGPDYDFGQGPMLFSDTASSTDLSLVGAGEKSGVFWTFRAKDGLRVWSRQVSPGGGEGGMEWGSATDGKTLYVSAANSGPTTNIGGPGSAAPWTLLNGQVVHSGGWAAVDAASGKVQWTTPDPFGSRAVGPVTLANGVVFGCNMQGTMFALSAKSGTPLWQYQLATAHACTAGAAIVNGMVFWGSGDGHNTANAAKTLFAFGL